MFEHHQQPLLPRHLFLRRLARNIGYGILLLTVSLAVGMLGYHHFAGHAWTDAFLNAAMILSGMGPVDVLHTTAAKIFAGCYALYAGIALISTIAVIFAPLVHRVMHRFHFESEDET